MPVMPRRLAGSVALLLVGAAIPAAAQTAPSPSAPQISGTIRGNYQYLFESGQRRDFNQFTLERVYVTLRGAVVPKLDYRVTTDVYQTAPADNNGWTVRLKYAYLDYTFGASLPWETMVRAGILQTVTIEQQEAFWPRWLGPVPIDRHGFFQSADAGIAVRTALPNRLGEVYTHVVNGSGYTRREVDKFKDFAGRISLTPFSARENPLLASLTLSGWGYAGTLASRFSDDPFRPVGAGRTRDRWGLHAAVKDPNLTLAAEHSRRIDDIESGGNTDVDPLLVSSRAGAVTAGYAIVRPLAWFNATGTSRLGLVGRYDHVEPDREIDGDYHYLLGGLIYDFNRRFGASLNFQEQLGSSAPGPFRGAFLNFFLDF